MRSLVLATFSSFLVSVIDAELATASFALPEIGEKPKNKIKKEISEEPTTVKAFVLLFPLYF